MSSTYKIDFSDPRKPGFSIAPGAFNGPGASTASTTLRLYGRGALEWGEAVNEDLVRLAENFASASPPSSPVPGQMWVETFTYYKDTTQVSTSAGWYVYDQTSLLWKLVNDTGNVLSSAPPTPVEGQYYYDVGTGTLKGYYSLGKYEPLAWVTRSHMTGAGAPSTVMLPRVRVRVRSVNNTWDFIEATTFMGVAAPSAPTPGMFWFNPTTTALYIRSNTGSWITLRANNGETYPANGPISMQGFRLVDVAAPSAGTDATNKTYVDAAIAAAIASALSGIGTGNYLPLAGGTLVNTTSGMLNIQNTSGGTSSLGFTSGTAASIYIGQDALSGRFAIADNAGLYSAWLFLSNSTMQLNVPLSISGGMSVTGGITVTTGITMNGSKISLLDTGTNPSDAVNLAQMNTAISAAVGTGGANAAQVYTSGSYKAGDIAVVSGKIYIATAAGSGAPPGGNWKQVFPATYS